MVLKCVEKSVEIWKYKCIQAASSKTDENIARRLAAWEQKIQRSVGEERLKAISDMEVIEKAIEIDTKENQAKIDMALNEFRIKAYEQALNTVTNAWQEHEGLIIIIENQLIKDLEDTQREEEREKILKKYEENIQNQKCILDITIQDKLEMQNMLVENEIEKLVLAEKVKSDTQNLLQRSNNNNANIDQSQINNMLLSLLLLSQIGNFIQFTVLSH